MLKRKITAVILAGAILMSQNGHLLVLQLYAWGSMFSKSVQETVSFEQAVEQTFGGEYPCEVCVVVIDNLDKPQSKNQPQSASQSVYKPVLLALAGRSVICFPAPERANLAFDVQAFELRSEEPQAPPPRNIRA